MATGLFYDLWVTYLINSGLSRSAAETGARFYGNIHPSEAPDFNPEWLPGTDTGGDDGGGGGSDEPDFDAVDQVIEENPWLKELEGIYDIITDLVIDDVPATSIAARVRETDVWKRRFKGIVARQRDGLPAISEAEYLNIERGYRQQLQQARILGTLGLDNPENFREWAAERIGSDVSVSEINRRVDQALAIARDNSNLTREAFETFYGVAPTEEALIVHALDEQRGIDEIERQIAAATVGGEAFRFGLNITRTRAELLQRTGVTADIARRGFADIAREEPLLRRLATIHRFQPLEQEELEDFFFHEDPEVAQRRARTFQQSLAEFQSGGPSGQGTRGGGLASLVDVRRTV